MIIRLTLQDSDLSFYLEDFCKHILAFGMFSEYDIPLPEIKKGEPEENERKLMEVEEKRKKQVEKKIKLLGTCKHFKKDSQEQKEIITEVLRLWKKYAKENDLERFTPEISIQYSLKEKNENGEVVYYFSRSDNTVVF